MDRLRTAIWRETPRGDNPFSPLRSHLRGRDYFREVAPDWPLVDRLLFQMEGALPDARRRRRVEMLVNLAADPGIRDESARVAMNTAIGGAPLRHAVLAGLLARTGAARGADYVERVMGNLAGAVERGTDPRDDPPFDGLGLHFGSPDARAADAAEALKREGFWGDHARMLEASATPEHPMLLEGVVAAGLLDAGIPPALGATLFLFAPFAALAAYAAEQAEAGLRGYPNFFAPGLHVYDGPAPGGGAR